MEVDGSPQPGVFHSGRWHASGDFALRVYVFTRAGELAYHRYSYSVSPTGTGWMRQVTDGSGCTVTDRRCARMRT